MRFSVVLMLAAATVLVARGAAAPPNIVLVTLDTTRADRMGFLGSTRGLTPALDTLAKQSTVFTRSFAQAPLTTVSHATILTGTFPPFHQVTDFGAPLPASVPFLPALLKEHGYRTGAFVGSLVLDPREGTAPGFERGFDVYDAGFRIRRPGESRYTTIERRGRDVVSRALAWLRASPSPSFAWIHLYDPHDPYDPPAELKTKYAAAPYDGEIAEVDRLVGVIAQAAGPDALLAIVGDHGEALGDHGESTHGVFLYDATLHVPLLIRLPEKRGAGVRIEARVRLADLAPTILDTVGARIPAAMQGATLLPLVDGKERSDRPAYAETDYPRRAFGWSPLAAWRNDRFLYVRAPRPELYDTTSDLAELRNLAASRSRVADGLAAEMEKFVRGAAGGAPAATAPDPERASRLSGLGYVSGSGGSGTADGVDPKDRIAIANELHDAVLAVEEGEFARAIPLLEKVTRAEPSIPIAHLNLGVARARQRQYALAVGPLTRAAELQPDNMLGRYELGVALYETGQLPRAAKEFEVVRTRMPKWADARFSLGSVYVRIQRVPEGVAELRAALALEPKHFRANLLLGRVLTLQGDAAGALPYLRAAVAAQPENAEAKAFLAEAVEKAK